MLQKIRVTENGARLDRYLAERLPEHSRSYIRKLLDEGRATLDGKPLKPSSKTISGSQVMLDVPEPELTEVKPQAIPLDIVYEDDAIIVVNKPQGMVVHPAAGHRDGTLVNALLQHCEGRLSDLNGVIRPGIVHRIDKDTSGLLLVVKDNRVHATISDRIRRHEIKRTYQAIVHGHVTAARGTIDAPIGRDPQQRQRMAVIAGGKPAISYFTPLQAGDKASWLEIELETGRTHQIRVHTRYIGHPIVGDPLYAGGRPSYGLEGQALHACRLSFVHPLSGDQLTLESPVPESFKKIAERLL